MKTVMLRSIPVLGWLYLAAGVVAAATDSAPRNRLLRAAWWVDLFLSVVVHAAQIPAALRAAAGSDRSAVKTAVLTQIFGMTWWATQEVMQ
ncbi:hypothetical protein [Nocardia sp. NBC_01009]|uniref:hypothetical protein n=1 Tax=Nocardia sp. NBC_01009 TaxID=2975996 RepID=UPI00387086E6|nr:hypothetical protein OHA42_21755 [Nocardia sp. NBC_01009]